MNDEKAWSENFGPFCLVGRKNGLFDRKVGDISESGREDCFYRNPENELGIQDIQSEALFDRLRSGQSGYLVGEYDHRDHCTNVKREGNAPVRHGYRVCGGESIETCH